MWQPCLNMMPDAVPPSACHLIVLGSQREREKRSERAQHPTTQHVLWDIVLIVLCFQFSFSLFVFFFLSPVNRGRDCRRPLAWTLKSDAIYAQRVNPKQLWSTDSHENDIVRAETYVAKHTHFGSICLFNLCVYCFICGAPMLQLQVHKCACAPLINPTLHRPISPPLLSTDGMWIKDLKLESHPQQTH